MRTVALATILAVAAHAAQAQQYPTKPVRIVTPNAPGVSTDLLARGLAERLQQAWNQAVFVENRPGADGVIGTDLVARSAPDGYTLLVAPAGVFTFHPALYEKLPYEPLRDFTPITLLAQTTIWVVVHPSLPVSSMKELIQLAKSQPGKLSYSTVGGTIGLPYLASIVVQNMTGARMVYINYKGGNQALADLLGNQIQVMYDAAPGSLPHVRNGRLRALAVISPRRMKQAPDVPTIAEIGVPEATGLGWNGLSARAGTPREIIRRIYSDAVAGLRHPDFSAKLNAIGFDIVGNTPEEFVAQIKSEMQHWGKMIRDNGIRAQ